MKIIVSFSLLICLAACQTRHKEEKENSGKPNIIIINMDDLGYGDVGAYGATELKTPNFDRLANGGIRFTNGHSTSSTCTPSRFALITGVYPWRNSEAKILPGTAPLIIDTAQATIASVLKGAGYRTGVVGKWHLGLGDGHADWNKPISPGPNQLGFDYAYIMAATQDRVPTVYIEDGSVVGLDPNDPIEVSYEQNFEGEPTALTHPEMLTMKWHHGHNQSIVNGVPRIGFMKGGKKALWKDEDMADHFLAKARDFVESNKNQPFFLYYAMQQPHVPRTPHPRFAGTTGLGPRGDVIAEADWCVGEFLKTLEDNKLLENTLIIFTSDNGPVVNDGYHDDAVEKLGKHTPAGPLRGGKYSLFEGGTRVPFITYWKGTIQPGVSDALVCQVDLMASLSALAGQSYSGQDSQDLLDVLLGKSSRGRANLVLEASGRTALREGDWLLIPPYKGQAVNKHVNIELGNALEYQLYDLGKDLAQQHNLAKENEEKVKQMAQTLESIQGKPAGDVPELELK
ncbi:MAG: arylsulfatase [Cytophagaceae bacterium SCN 52-12]|nr:MAG: arylsulfatase [Cytophagaceae bacterium SCN 52-12]